MRGVLSGLALAAALAVSSTAQAAAYLATYTGVVSDSYALQADSAGGHQINTNDFGAVDGAFDGATFTLKYRYDTSVGSETKINWTDNLIGLEPNSPITWAGISINGQTASIGPISRSLVTAFNGIPIGFPDVRGFGHQADYYSDDGQSFRIAEIFLYNITVDAELNQTFSGPPSGGDTPYSTGDFALQRYNAATDRYRISGGNLIPTYLTVEAIPEPASWALMLTGFAGLGAALRRRRSAARPLA